MKLLKILLLSALVPATAGEASAAGTSTAQEADRMVCRSVVATGTRFGKRICKPARAWAAITERSEQTVREIHSRPQICTGKEGC